MSSDLFHLSLGFMELFIPPIPTFGVKNMNEWYVYSEAGKPFEVILGRKEAVARLLQGEFKTTPEERKQISRFIEGNVCDLGSGLHLVGLVKNGEQEPMPDRRLTRCIGPGALV